MFEWVDKLFKKKLAAEEKDNTLVIPQFDSAQCVDGGLDNGETFATTEIADGVKGVVCMLAPKEEGGEGSVEVQSLIFDKEKFDAEAAQAWAEGNDFKLASRGHRQRLSFAATHPTRRFSCSFAEFKKRLQEEGAPPAEMKDSESVTSLEETIMAQFRERGWAWASEISGEQSLEYDFMIEAHFPEQKAVIVVDFITGKYYSVSYSGEGDAITVADPQETDLIFEPAGAPKPEAQPEPAPAQAARMRGHGSLGRLGDQKPPAWASDPEAFPLLALTSGWTGDIPKDNQPKRWIDPAGVQDAFDRKLLNNANCYWQHSENQAMETRPVVPFGYAIPGSDILKANTSGGLDYWVDVKTYDNTPGRDIKPILQRSKDENKPQTKSSLVFDVEREFGEVDGRPAEIYRKFTAIYAIDFMDNAAMDRTGVRAAASRSTAEGELTMGDKEELERLRLKVAEDADTVKQATLAVREKEVDGLIAASGVPREEFASLRVILLKTDDADVRKALAEEKRTTYFKSLKRTPGGPQGDGGNDDPATELSPEMRADMAKVVTRHGLTKEHLEKARENVRKRLAERVVV